MKEGKKGFRATRGIALCIAIAMLFTLGLHVSAADTSVNSESALKTAIENAPTGAGPSYVIEITDNITLTEVLTIPVDTDITLISGGGGTVTITSAASQRHFLVLGNLTLEDIVIQGNDPSDGGGVTVTGGSLTMKDGAVIQYCRASIGGGSGTGVLVTNGTFYMHGGEIAHNSNTSGTSASGGGLALTAASRTDENTGSVGYMYGGSIHDNANTWSGGVDVGLYSNFTMDKGEIYGNEALVEGGGGVSVYVRATFIMNGGSIRNNAAKTTGGGVFVGQSSRYGNEPDDWCSFIMNGGDISGNEAELYGGGVSAQFNGNVTIHDGLISKNTAEGGGGIYLADANTDDSVSLQLYGGEISDNIAHTYYGGAICAISSLGSNGRIKEIEIGSPTSNIFPVIRGNQGTTTGGGIALYQTKATMYAGEISGNQANGGLGGGVYVWANSMLTVLGGTIEDNRSSTSGGGIATYGGGNSIWIEDSVIMGNRAESAGSGGGGIYLGAGDTANLLGTSIRENVASVNHGGGIYVAQTADLNIIGGSELTGNTAAKEGGGIYTGDFTPAPSGMGDYAITASDYANIKTAGDTIFSGNSADGLYNAPEDVSAWYSDIQFASISASDALTNKHPINNFDINYVKVPAVEYYTVTYHASNGTGNTYISYASVGAAHRILDNAAGPGFSYQDHSFLGWSDLEGDTAPNASYAVGELVGGEIPANGNIDIFAIWEENVESVYSITYHSNYGADATYSGADDANLSANTVYTVKDYAGTTLSTRTGYTFRGWSYSASGSVNYTAADCAAGTALLTISGDVDLYAVWQSNGSSGGGSTTYTVTYNANGGTGSDRDSGLSSGTAYTIKSSAAAGISREGYTFTGWNTEADTAGTPYAPADTIRITANVTLYAQWVEDGGTSGPELNMDDHMAYIIGYPDGTVQPEADIRRAEVATIFFRLLTDDSRSVYWATSNRYSDLSGDDWYHNAVSTMTNAGILTGYPDGVFGGSRPITRAEFATIAARFSESTYTGADKFSDISGHWAAEYMNRAAEEGWITGYTDGTFRPDQNITRAEAMTLINRVLERHEIEDMHEDMILWPDNDVSAWHYHAVQEATNSHLHTRLENGKEMWTAVTDVPNWSALEQSWSAANSHLEAQ